jgi:hypothetical protein
MALKLNSKANGPGLGDWGHFKKVCQNLTKAFPSLVEHQAVKDNATKQRLRAKCRFCENSFCSIAAVCRFIFASVFRPLP